MRRKSHCAALTLIETLRAWTTYSRRSRLLQRIYLLEGAPVSAWSAWFIDRACLGALLAALSIAAGYAGVVKSEEPYIWSNVKWGGGGFVTGIVAHPTAP